jgi:hypothetical protein
LPWRKKIHAQAYNFTLPVLRDLLTLNHRSVEIGDKTERYDARDLFPILTFCTGAMQPTKDREIVKHAPIFSAMLKLWA